MTNANAAAAATNNPALRAYTLSGALGGEAILLVKGEAAVLVDSGFDFCADLLAAKIKATLGEIPLSEIILTHSHYDHLGGCVAVQQLYPEAKIIANPLVRQIVAKESARQTMRRFNHEAAAVAGMPPLDRIDQLQIDYDLAPGETRQTAIGPILAISTPGHTRCSTSYYLPEDDTLILSETTGVIVDQHYAPCFVVSYRATEESFDRCEQFHAQRIIVPHYGLIEGEQAAEFLVRSRAASTGAAQFVLEHHAAGQSEEEILEDYAAKYYYGLCDRAQPEGAFRINTSTMISRVIAEAEAERAAQQ